MAEILERTLSACFYGLEKSYPEYLSLMHDLHARVAHNLISDQLMLLEHKPVITYTRQHKHKSLLTNPEEITNSGIDLYEADRGGDATFHGPGQLVGYPIINIKNLDIITYIRKLEESLLLALKNLGLKSLLLIPGFTGIWLKNNNSKINLKKLCAIGVGIKDGVSKHGFALNITINSAPYVKHIIPCGLQDRGIVTLKEAFLEEDLEMPDYSAILMSISESIAQTFSLKLCFKGLYHG